MLEQLLEQQSRQDQTGAASSVEIATNAKGLAQVKVKVYNPFSDVESMEEFEIQLGNLADIAVRLRQYAIEKVREEGGKVVGDE
jgi:hypothetical protein